MQIKFTCPQGHQLSADRSRIGKPGKCPKCGTEFVVPDASEDEAQKSSKSKSSEATFAFLCPNGHELNGPISLRGRPGQCPHCGEKFLIPEADDESGEEPQIPAEITPGDKVTYEAPPKVFPAQDSSSGDEVPTGEIVEVAAEDILLDDEDIPAGELEVGELSIEEELTLEEDVPQVSGISRKSSGIMTKSDQHSLLQLIAWMWDRKSSENQLEIVMRDGDVVRAVRYSPKLSSGEYGVFAEKSDDGSHTIYTVAWDAVSRVALRNVKDLPERYFE